MFCLRLSLEEFIIVTIFLILAFLAKFFFSSDDIAASFAGCEGICRSISAGSCIHSKCILSFFFL